MPSSALTRFLKQGLARGMCPLCRVAHKVDREYIWYFFDEYSDQAWALDEVRRARGFCAEHAAMLRRVEVDGLSSTLGISTVYEDTLERLAADLEVLNAKGTLDREPCPACAYRDEELGKNARHLLDEVAESERSRERFDASPGLCIPHFGLVWRVARPDERNLILDVQRRAVGGLLAELREHLRKQEAEHAREPKGAEQDAWLRALWLTAGWPGDPAEDLSRTVSLGDAAPR
jgi:hypothetical protein